MAFSSAQPSRYWFGSCAMSARLRVERLLDQTGELAGPDILLRVVDERGGWHLAVVGAVVVRGPAGVLGPHDRLGLALRVASGEQGLGEPLPGSEAVGGIGVGGALGEGSGGGGTGRHSGGSG